MSGPEDDDDVADSTIHDVSVYRIDYDTTEEDAEAETRQTVTAATPARAVSPLAKSVNVSEGADWKRGTAPLVIRR